MLKKLRYHQRLHQDVFFKHFVQNRQLWKLDQKDVFNLKNLGCAEKVNLTEMHLL